MKNTILTLAILVSSFVFAQANEPIIEAVGKSVKATYYYDNGKVQQEGFFVDGKLDGKWISYDVNGNVVTIAEYTQGQKSGKWQYFDNAIAVREVDYSNNQIAAVKEVKANE